MANTLSESDVDPNPLKQFEAWYGEALASGVPEADAMTLATATTDGAPDARIVLLKSFDDRGFVFFTNYQSRKAEELAANGRACLLFYWLPLKRQVRIEGTVDKVSAAESDDYFHTRPWGSKLGAWASDQSRVITSRENLEKRFAEFEVEFADNVPRPPHWGGYRLIPTAIEFWQGRDNRLHEREEYSRPTAAAPWTMRVLNP